MRNRGFTLMEIVLAIGLSGAVLGLLTMSINLYLIRVDASRTQVETAQLARTLLNLLANDLQAARYFPESSSSSSDSDFEDDTSGTFAPQGIIGTATELRIDRSAVWQWEHVMRLVEARDANVEADLIPDQTAMPQTVRYVLGEGDELLADKLAAAGVSERPLASNYAGLYREQLSTAAWLEQNFAGAIPLTGDDTGDAELIAPEVVDITFEYFDGQVLRTEWDSSLEEGLPKGVEIRLTLLELPLELSPSRTTRDRDELRDSKENLVEFRRFVKLPDVREPYEAKFPGSGGSSSGSSGFGRGL